MPGRQALEVRPARVRIADALGDDQLPGFQQLTEVPERWVQTDVIVDLDLDLNLNLNATLDLDVATRPSRSRSKQIVHVQVHVEDNDKRFGSLGSA